MFCILKKEKHSQYDVAFLQMQLNIRAAQKPTQTEVIHKIFFKAWTQLKLFFGNNYTKYNLSHILFVPAKVEGKISTWLPASEFVINALKSSTINEEELRKRSVLDKTEPKKRGESLVSTGAWNISRCFGLEFSHFTAFFLSFFLFCSEVIPEWERELQEELEEYDVLADTEIHDEAWDREIEELLNEELW